MHKKKSLWLWLLDILEIFIPAALFMILFICFLIGVFFRYLVKNPQSWTFELSTIAFLGAVIFAGCLSDRYGEHISFDMIYDKRTEKTKTIMRIISNSLIIVFLGSAFPASMKFILSLNNLTTPIMKIPQTLVFCCFPVLFADLIIRSVVHLVVDIKTIKIKISTTCDSSSNNEVEK